MKILLIYRSLELGPSIRRVFQPLEAEMRKSHEVDAIYLPIATASPFDILKNIKYVKQHLDSKRYDIIHITGHVHYLTWALRHQNTVVTVHDLGFYTGCSSKCKKALLYAFFVYPLKYAKRLTFISEKSLLEANNVLSLRGDIQSVIYNPVDRRFAFKHKEINTQYPVVLHIGTKPNKNLPRVLEAVSNIPCRLHIVGPLTEEMKVNIEEKGIDVKLDAYLSDEQVKEAYEQCDIVCFASLYEGFGLPIIEAQAVGRPVVTSRIEPLCSIAKDAAILVDPYSAEKIKNGLLSALQNATKMIEKGLENVKRFNVESIANEYTKVYESLNNLA